MITKIAEYLYHGSSKKHKILLPKNEHGDTEKPPLVFLSPKKEFALGYAGARWTDANLNQGYINNKPYFLELKKGVIDKTFNRPGYLHYIDKKSINNDLKGQHTGSSFEVATKNKVTPVKAERIGNVLAALKNSGVTMQEYDPNSREYKQAVKRMSKRVKILGDDYSNYIKINNPELHTAIKALSISK